MRISDWSSDVCSSDLKKRRDLAVSRGGQMSSPGQPLHGVRVLDLTTFLSGPFCTQILADLGAEVIKVEPPGGDSSRHIPPHFLDGQSLYFLGINRNKQSISIDLKTDRGRQLQIGRAHV